MTNMESMAIKTKPDISVRAQVFNSLIRKGGQDLIKSTLRKDQKDMIARWETQAKQGREDQQQMSVNVPPRDRAIKSGTQDLLRKAVTQNAALRATR